MSDVLLTSLLEDKKSFFQVSLTNELLSWERVVANEGATSGGWGQAQRLKQRECILSSSPSAVATDINSRRTVMTRYLLGVSTSDTPSKRAKIKSTTSTTTVDAHASASSYSDASTLGVSAAVPPVGSGSPVDSSRGGDSATKTDSYLNSNSQSNSPNIASHHAG